MASYASVHPLTQGTVARLQTLSEGKYFDVLTIPEVNQRVTRLFGNRAGEFKSYNQQGNNKLSDGLLIIEACMHHFCASNQGMVVIKLSTGETAGALQKETTVSTYLGDYKTLTEAPSVLRSWIKENKELDEQIRSRTAARNTDEAHPKPTYSDSLINVESITTKPYYNGSILVATVYNKSPYALNTTIINVNCYDKRGVQIDNATFVFNDLAPNSRAVKNMTGALSTRPARVQIVRVSHD